MTAKETKSASQSARIKVALIPILGLILILVFVSRSTEKAMSAPPGTTSTRSEAVEFIAAKAKEIARTPKTPWPNIPLDAILSHNPFATPPFLSRLSPVIDKIVPDMPDRAEKKSIDNALTALKQKPPRIMLQSESGVVTIIDSKIYREGDQLEQGLRIKKISSEGITLEIDH